MTTRTVLAWLLIAAALSILSCQKSKTSDRSLTWVDAATAQQLSEGERKLIGKRAEAAFVDCRSPTEYAAVHIPGAISLPFQDVSGEHARKLAGRRILIVYGRDYGDPKADAMSKRLIELGYTDVRTLSGGLLAWKNAGYPVDESETTASEGDGG